MSWVAWLPHRGNAREFPPGLQDATLILWLVQVRSLAMKGEELLLCLPQLHPCLNCHWGRACQ